MSEKFLVIKITDIERVLTDRDKAKLDSIISQTEEDKENIIGIWKDNQ